jgi:hypothetical protein
MDKLQISPSELTKLAQQVEQSYVAAKAEARKIMRDLHAMTQTDASSENAQTSAQNR